MKIRKAKEQDIEGLLELLLQVCSIHHQGRPDLFKEGGCKYTKEQLSVMLLEEDKPIFVAIDEEERVRGYAFCFLQQHLNDNMLTDIKTLYIDDLCVDVKYREQKIGSTLYQWVLDYAKEAGCYNVTLNVWNLNQTAMKFYEKCGLKPQKVGMETILPVG